MYFNFGTFKSNENKVTTVDEKKILKNFPETVKDLHCGFQGQNFWQRNTNFITKITVTSL